MTDKLKAEAALTSIRGGTKTKTKDPRIRSTRHVFYQVNTDFRWNTNPVVLTISAIQKYTNDAFSFQIIFFLCYLCTCSFIEINKIFLDLDFWESEPRPLKLQRRKHFLKWYNKRLTEKWTVHIRQRTLTENINGEIFLSFSGQVRGNAGVARCVVNLCIVDSQDSSFRWNVYIPGQVCPPQFLKRNVAPRSTKPLIFWSIWDCHSLPFPCEETAGVGTSAY